MPSLSESQSPMKRPTFMTRTFSQQSVARESPGGTTAKKHRASVARIHARTPSYGKNLHKLTKIVSGNDDVDFGVANKKKVTTPTSPHGTAGMRRNTSAVSLSKNIAKAPVRKNKSEVTLLRNHSTAQLHRAKQNLPLRRNESHGKNLDKSKHHKHSKQFEMEDDEGEWTEESVSPVITRQSSLSRGSKNQSRLNSPPREIPRPLDMSNIEPDGSEDVLPGSPPNPRMDLEALDQTARTQLLDRRHSRDTEYLASQIASAQAMNTKPERLSNIQEQGSTSSENANRNNDQTPPSPDSSRDTSAAMSQHSSNVFNMDSIKRAASERNLRKPIVYFQDSRADAKVPSYTIAAAGPNRTGAATQTKIELWKSQGNVEQFDGPLASLPRGAFEMLNNDERKVKLWEAAEKELSCVRRFVNPVLEGAKRATAKGKDHKIYTHTIKYMDHKHLNGVARQNHHGPRPPSRAGPRSVRFEVGGEDDFARNEGPESVEQILRRMWNSTDNIASVEG